MTIQNPTLYVARTMGELKALGNGKFKGLLARFSEPTQPDLSNDHFTKTTNFFKDVGDTLPLLYEHGLDETLKTKRLGKAIITAIDDVGVWIEGQIDVADKYGKAIYNHLVKTGKAGLSSGAAPHMVTREKSGTAGVKTVTEWGMAEASLTPKPMEPLTRGLEIKSLDDYAEELSETTPVDWLKCTCGDGDISAEEEDEDKKALPGSTTATPNKPHKFEPKDGDTSVCSICGKAGGDSLHEDAPPLTKPEDDTEGKSLLGDKMDAIAPSIWTLRDALNDVLRDLATLYRLRNVNGGEFILESRVTEAITEYAARLIPMIVEQIEQFEKDAAKPGYTGGITSGSEPVFYLRSLPPASLPEFVKSLPVPGETLDQHSARAVSAVEEFAPLSEGVVKSLEVYAARVKDKVEFRRADPKHTGQYLGAPTQLKLATILEAARTSGDRLKSVAAALEELQTAAVKAATPPASAESVDTSVGEAKGLTYEQIQLTLTQAEVEAELTAV